MVERNKAMEEVNMKYERLMKCTVKEIKQRMNDWDTEKWKKEMDNKTSLEIYRERKNNIKEVVKCVEKRRRT